MMNLFMVRHGEIPANVKKVYAGRSAESLTDRGIRQAEEAAEKLKTCDIQSIYSSPIQRAVQTAEIIQERLGRDIIVVSALREMDLGPWEGLSEIDVAHIFSEEWNVWNSRPADLALPGRETLHELHERVLGWIKNIYPVEAKRNIVIITHVAVIRVLLLWHEGKSLNLYKTVDVPNAEIFSFPVNAGCFP